MGEALSFSSLCFLFFPSSNTVRMGPRSHNVLRLAPFASCQTQAACFPGPRRALPLLALEASSTQVAAASTRTTTEEDVLDGEEHEYAVND